MRDVDHESADRRLVTTQHLFILPLEVAVRTVEFWKGALERAAKSAAQTLLLMWISDVPLDLLQIDATRAVGLAAGAAVLSVCTSIVSAPLGPKGSPSLVDDTPGRHRAP